MGGRVTLIAELSTNHGGDVSLALEMVRAGAEAGADYVKIQTYDVTKLAPNDPQEAWLRQSWLSREAHEQIQKECQAAGVGFLSTPFDVGSLAMLRRELGLMSFKIASSESGADWWDPRTGERWFVSHPWGEVGASRYLTDKACVNLTAIPLYPTPLEAVGRATLLEGWSDHTVGLDACRWALARGVSVLEVHMALPDKGRRQSWDKLPHEVAELRRYADAVQTITSGVSTVFRERWKGGGR